MSSPEIEASHVDRTAHPPPARPLFVFDGECGFCKAWVARWKVNAEHAVDFAAYQDVATSFPDVPRAQFAVASQLLEPDGAILSGAAGIFRVLAHGGSGALSTVYRRFGGFALAADAIYRVVARRRSLAARVTHLLVGHDVRRPTFLLTRWVFLRLLGVIALAAFVSFGRQAPGLIGSHGIAPAARFLAELHAYGASAGWTAFETRHVAPSLMWIAPSDGMLTALTAAGIAASLALIVDVAPAFAVLAIWLAYLSLATVGGVFMQYQWDALLLETCLAALFLAPWRVRPRLLTDRPPSLVGVWVLRLLVFKLMFMSGIVKRVSGDPTWRDLTALDYHYWTQPLPMWTSWYAGQLSPRVQAACTWWVLVIETYVPFLVFVPRTPRYAAFTAFVILQVAIATTGNYGFFNALSVALAFVLLDDGVLARALPRAARARMDELRGRRVSPSRRAKWAVPFAATIALLGAFRVVGTVDRSFEPPPPFGGLSEWLAPFASVNGYGLFAVMTTHRPEIQVEGSADGVTWVPYTFKWKPGADVTARPRIDFMDMPRLDWQMWFAALEGSCQRTRWYVAFVKRLLEGSPEVTALLAEDPFPDHPPRFVRSRMFETRFTNAGERAATGAWWSRSEVRPFCPVLTLLDGDVVVAESRTAH
jgi:predicted DCC family thiol-disulfide oxidoreductase YuxK